MSDMVNHPSHYNQNGVETIDIIEEALTEEEFRGFLKGNIIKYLDRHEFKNGEQDLEKAQWYALKMLNIIDKCVFLEVFDLIPLEFRKILYYLWFMGTDGNKQSAIKHWEEYRNELSKKL